MDTRIDHIAGGIHRISTWVPAFGITFNQFLIVDEKPALIHTGEHAFYDNVGKAVAQVIGYVLRMQGKLPARAN